MSEWGSVQKEYLEGWARDALRKRLLITDDMGSTAFELAIVLSWMERLDIYNAYARMRVKLAAHIRHVGAEKFEEMVDEALDGEVLNGNSDNSR